MFIREATSRDIWKIVDFQQSMALETESKSLDIGILTAGVQKLFNDPAKGKYYVVEGNGEIVGCLMTTFEWSDWRDGNVLWIQSVYISEEFRGQGFFKKLYEHIQSMVQSDPNLKGIRLYVDKTNKAAQEVYEKLGMNGDHYQVYEWMKS